MNIFFSLVFVFVFAFSDFYKSGGEWHLILYQQSAQRFIHLLMMMLRLSWACCLYSNATNKYYSNSLCITQLHFITLMTCNLSSYQIYTNLMLLLQMAINYVCNIFRHHLLSIVVTIIINNSINVVIIIVIIMFCRCCIYFLLEPFNCFAFSRVWVDEKRNKSKVHKRQAK